MNALAPVAPKLAKLLPRLASNHDGEVIATARAIERTLHSAGLDWHAVADRVEREPETRIVVIRETVPERYSYRPPPHWRPKPSEPELLTMAAWCCDQPEHLFKERKVSDRKARFVYDMRNQLACGLSATPKQSAWLRSIYFKLRGQP